MSFKIGRGYGSHPIDFQWSNYFNHITLQYTHLSIDYHHIFSDYFQRNPQISEKFEPENIIFELITQIAYHEEKKQIQYIWCPLQVLFYNFFGLFQYNYFRAPQNSNSKRSYEIIEKHLDWAWEYFFCVPEIWVQIRKNIHLFYFLYFSFIHIYIHIYILLQFSLP